MTEWKGIKFGTILEDVLTIIILSANLKKKQQKKTPKN